MRVLIDECIDPRVKTLLGDHESATVHERSWGALEDGRLLAVARDEFDVLLTIDRKLEHQQNIPKLGMGLVVAHVRKNQLAFYKAIQTELLAAIARVQRGQVIHVGLSR